MHTVCFSIKTSYFFSKAIPILVATADPICNSQKIMTNASNNYDKGSCGYTTPMYHYLWEITRYYNGDDTVGIIEGDHTTSKHLILLCYQQGPMKKNRKKKRKNEYMDLSRSDFSPKKSFL